jgi:thiol-disulfide isomerase/thioredoxin
MMSRHKLLALACCAFSLLLMLAPWTTVRGDGRGPDRTRQRRRAHEQAARKRVAAVTAKSLAATLPPVPLLDAAGIKQLFARGTPPNDRPLLVNFWATWCEPCREEFPDLVKIDADYRGRGLQFAAISVDDPGEADKGVPKFLTEMRAQMPAYILNVTDSEPVINSVDPDWGGELPATFLFDKHGQVVFKHKGRVNPTELRAALDKVLSND